MEFLEVTFKLFEGFGNTCLIFILSLVLSLPLGLIVTFGSMSKISPIKYITSDRMNIRQVLPKPSNSLKVTSKNSILIHPYFTTAI